MAYMNLNFAYDDAFRTMTVECDDIVLPFLNYAFGENFDNSAKIIRRGNEHFIEKESGDVEKRITDGFLEVVSGDIVKKYHIECESEHTDEKILVRIFE